MARAVKVVGFLGISDYGLGQFELLVQRYKVAFATAKRKPAAHAEGLDAALAKSCAAHGVEFLGSVDANCDDVVERARGCDLVVLGGYDALLRGPLLAAPRYGVLNTHLGVLPLNRGCCPTLWAQLHGLPQGYTTYCVGPELDFGDVVDLYVAPPELGGVCDTNRTVYDALAAVAVERFGAALDRFEAGTPLQPCSGREAYHRKGMPNNGWLSFHWRTAFLQRFSLALDFAPYLPGRARVGDAEVSLAVLGPEAKDKLEGAVGEVLEVKGEELVVRVAEGAVRCRACAGQVPAVGTRLSSGRPEGEEACAHPVPVEFGGEELDLERYLCQPRG